MDQTNINPETQKMLNSPLVKPQGLSTEDQAFLNLIIAKVEAKEIDLLAPGTLLNHPVYDKLAPEAQGKVDFDAMNLTTTLRNIYWLWKSTNGTHTFQAENLVHQVRLTKERLEQISGDVFVI